LVPQYIFRLSGEPLGFIHANALYDFDDRFMAWIDRDGTVWSFEGRYLGDLVENAYILRNTTRLPPLDRPARVLPLLPPPPTRRPLPRMPRERQGSWIDGL
jgi:hypothetical protein